MSIHLLVTSVHFAKAADAIEMSFVLLTRVGPRNCALKWGPDPKTGNGHLHRRKKLEGAQECIYPPSGFGEGDGLGREMGCMREMADALWERRALL